MRGGEIDKIDDNLAGQLGQPGQLDTIDDTVVVVPVFFILLFKP